MVNRFKTIHVLIRCVRVCSILSSPTAASSCDSSLCVPASTLPAAALLSLSPSRGMVTGGTEVVVGLSNFPAAGAGEVVVSVQGSDTLALAASILSYSSVGTISANKGVLRFAAPAVALPGERG